MGQQKFIKPISIEDYLVIEEQGEERHEYYHGAIEAMVGGTARHNKITTAITSILRSHLKGKGCSIFSSDMKVFTNDVFYYPDVMVVCESVDPESLYQTKPIVLVEILSKSTEKKDRLEKLVAYQSIETVNEYILVSQERIAVDVYTRQPDGWQLDSLLENDLLIIHSLKYSAPVDNFYEDVIDTFK